MISQAQGLTGSLEDYLEAILRILGESSVARVRDIADRLQVSPASVTPAMKRLADLGLISYTKRSYIQLTDAGRRAAMRTATRHSLLYRFLNGILGADPEQSDRDACAMEHHLSDDSMERLAAFFEFLAACPELASLLDRGFGSCLEGLEETDTRCSMAFCPLVSEAPGTEQRELTPLSQLPPGESRTIARIGGGRELRKNLLDRGFIQGAEVALERPGSDRLPCIILLGGYRMEIPLEAAGSIYLHPAGTGTETC
ncbi:MAG: hypothetical protein AVO35_02950 [Candidatus Aegiribacteria sp. MLS_C]|nr:MAG: hypothetical protein AVO35_02950 [Candidatus Aegiribacteria sp. MLS_C]